MGRLVRAFPFALYLSSVAVASQDSGAAAVAQNNSEAAPLARIDSLATGEAEAGLLSGVILVARGDRILLQRAYGFASWELTGTGHSCDSFRHRVHHQTNDRDAGRDARD